MAARKVAAASRRAPRSRARPASSSRPGGARAPRIDPESRSALEERILLAEEQARRSRRKDPASWLIHYLPEPFHAGFGEFHRGIFDDLRRMLWREPIEGAERVSAAWAYPRGHGKTTAITLGALAWIAHEWESMPFFEGRPPFILIVSSSWELARDRVLDLRSQLETNDRTREDYGSLVPADVAASLSRKRGRRRKLSAAGWTQHDVTLANGVRIRAVAALGQVRGLLRKGVRPSLIVLDDLEEDRSVVSQKHRDALERWLLRSLLPTGISGSLLTWYVGTILHPDSVLARSLNPKGERARTWLRRRYAALYSRGADGSLIADVHGTIPLWPEYWTLAKLQARRDEIGSLAFAAEYQNQPVDDGTTLFPMDWIEAARLRGAGRGFLYQVPARIPWSVATSTWDPVALSERVPDGAYQVVVQAWDLAVVADRKAAEAKDSDYTVGITVGLTADERLEVRRVVRARGLTPEQIRQRVVGECAAIRPDLVAIENNAAQRVYEIDLRPAIASLGARLIGHTTTSRKSDVFEGVPSLSLLFECGTIDLCGSTPQERAKVDALASELHGLGLEVHDDTVMALWIAVSAIRRWVRARDRERTRRVGAAPANRYTITPARTAKPARAA
jgi:phage terminase large subunit-like protein